MHVRIYRLHFHTAVHFGDGALTTCAKTLRADTLFSALCSEAVRCSEEETESFYRKCADARIAFSDLLPYIGERLYIPKPLVRIVTEDNGDSVVKKAMKKLDYIPVGILGDFLNGQADIKSEADRYSSGFGTSFLVTKADMMSGEEATPYNIEAYSYADKSGLYCAVRYEEDEDIALFDKLLRELSVSGIGGKVSSGYGTFEILQDDSAREDEEALRKLIMNNTDAGSRYMSLSVALPADDELDKAIDGAAYSMIKRGGFIASYEYADSFKKKRDLFAFASGSVFVNAFKGDVYDVSGGNGTHPVWRYLKPLFIAV